MIFLIARKESWNNLLTARFVIGFPSVALSLSPSAFSSASATIGPGGPNSGSIAPPRRRPSKRSAFTPILGRRS